jgi:RHS repeat-associated protein
MLKNRQILHICRKKYKNRVKADVSYDPVGRINAFNQSGTATPVSSITFTYDANGSLLNDGLRHYAYDSEGRLAAASLGWASTATADDSITKYAHNALAQRVFKTAPLYAVTNPDPAAAPTVLAAFTAFFESLWDPTSATTTAQKAGMSYVYDEDGTLIADTLTGGATTTWGQSARYIYLPTASGPMPVTAIYGTKHYAVQSDHLNTPRRLVQSDGQVAWQWAYSAFGDEKPTIAKTRFANADLNQSFGSTTVPAVTFNLRYPGQYFDQESGLHYNYHRSYSATTGRYTQSDPIGLDGGWNRFGYVGQNPLSFTDPLGLAWSCTTVGLVTTCTNSPPWNPDFPPGYTPPKPGFSWPSWMTPKTKLERCEADCEEEKTVRDALCFIAQAMGGKNAQRECLSRSDQIAYQCRKKCKDCPD